MSFKIHHLGDEVLLPVCSNQMFSLVTAVGHLWNTLIVCALFKHHPAKLSPTFFPTWFFSPPFGSLINKWLDYYRFIIYWPQDMTDCLPTVSFLFGYVPWWAPPLSLARSSFSLFVPSSTQQQSDRHSSGWLRLTVHLEMRTKVCNEAPKINRMWLIAATVRLDEQTVRTKAGEEMRGALSEES